jgi:hypothetical protein
MKVYVGLFSRDDKGNQIDADHGHKKVQKSHVEPERDGVHRNEDKEVLCKPDL